MRGFRRLRLGRCWALAWCICFSLCLLASTPRIYAETSSESAPDWPELQSYLDEIGSAFQNVTLSSEAESELLKEERQELESEKAASALERSEIASEKQNLSAERKRLEAEKKDLQRRGLLYDGMQKDLEKANKKLKHGWIWLLLAALAGGGLGYAIGR